MVAEELSLKKESLFFELLKAVGVALCGSFIIAASKPFTFYLPFSVIPISLQPHVALLVAFVLGREKGAMAILFFLLQGLMGLSVIGSGVIGVSVIYGPTAGYLLGYFVAALVMGSLKKDTFVKAFTVLAIGNLTIYLFGAVWLSGFIGAYKAVMLGVLPFLFLDYFKLLACAKLALSTRGHSLFE